MGCRRRNSKRRGCRNHHKGKIGTSRKGLGRVVVVGAVAKSRARFVITLVEVALVGRLRFHRPHLAGGQGDRAKVGKQDEGNELHHALGHAK